MIQINDPVRDKRIVGISDRDDDLLCVRCNRGIIIQHIRKLTQDNPRQLFLEKFISCDLQIFVDGKIHIIPCLRVCRADDLRYLAEIIHVKSLFSLLSFEHTVKGLLKA